MCWTRLRQFNDPSWLHSHHASVRIQTKNYANAADAPEACRDRDLKCPRDAVRAPKPSVQPKVFWRLCIREGSRLLQANEPKIRRYNRRPDSPVGIDPMPGRRWQPWEIEQLKQYISQALSASEIAIASRSHAAIQNNAARLGLVGDGIGRRQWSQAGRSPRSWR